MAAREQVITIHNISDGDLTKIRADLDWGEFWSGDPPSTKSFNLNSGGPGPIWHNEPPNTIAAGASIAFGGQSDGFMTGTEGTVVYRAENGDTIEIFWSSPFVGVDCCHSTVRSGGEQFGDEPTHTCAHTGAGRYLHNGEPWDIFVVDSFGEASSALTEVRMEVTYDAVWRLGDEGEMQYYRMTPEALISRYEKLWKKNWRIENLNAYITDAGRRYDAVWLPSASPEVQHYGLTYAAYKRHYDQLWSKNWRIHLLNTYEENNTIRYDAVWRPGTSAEIQHYGMTLRAFLKKYEELWSEDWRLHLLNTYSKGGRRRYDAVWRPGYCPEIHYFGLEHSAFQTKYEELWPHSWRLFLLNTYVERGKVLYDAVWRLPTSSVISPGVTSPRNSLNRMIQVAQVRRGLRTMIGATETRGGLSRMTGAAEMQYYGLSYKQYKDQYDKLWQDGWRIALLNTYMS